MGASKHIKRLLFEKDLKTADLAEKIDKPLQTLYNQINRDTWKFSEVEEIANKYNCDVVFIDRETKQIY